MRNGKFAARRSSGTKVVTLLLAVLVLVGCSVGATMAWLVKSTNEVVNTFTVGNIKIDLNEHVYDPATNTFTSDLTKTNSNYKLIPGKNMPKDPFVTVKADSEKCWLFVRIDETNNKGDTGEYGEIVHYIAAEGWTKLNLTGYDSEIVFYYRIVDTEEMDDPIYVLGGVAGCTMHTNGCVTIDPFVTSSTTTAPVLKFTAAAIQYDGLEVAVGDLDIDDLKGQAALKAFDNLPAAFKSTTNLNTPAPGGST